MNQSIIKNLCMQIKLKNLNDKQKNNKELNKLKDYIKNSDAFKGKKRKFIKIINSFKLK